jgi:hypothetical protein
MMQRPAYAVESIDHTLAALELLTQREAIRLSDLAGELGIGRATAHRLLRMLVYRGFALQRPDRSYAIGPALTRAAAQSARGESVGTSSRGGRDSYLAGRPGPVRDQVADLVPRGLATCS